MSEHVSASIARSFAPAAFIRNGAAMAMGDALAFLLAFAAAGTISLVFNNFGSAQGSADVTAAVVMRLLGYVAVVGLVQLWLFHLGHYRQRIPYWTELKQILSAVTLAALCDGFVQYVLKDDFSRFWVLQNWVLAASIVVAMRASVRRLLMRLGSWQLPTVIVGSRASMDEAMAALKSEPTLGYDIVGVIDIGDEADLQATIAAGGRRTSARRMLQSAYVRLGACFVVIAVDARDMIRTSQVVEELQRLTIPFAIIPPICGMSVLGLQAQYFFSHDVVLLTGRNNLSKPLSRLVKRAFDIAVASALLVVLAPFLLFTAAAIRRDGGPALFRHLRIGKDGRTFRCFKFRTMVIDADRVLGELLAGDPAAAAEWGRDFKLRNDPRVTAIGRFLRRTSLDELPQLINVIRGEMSLVGPRPIIKAEADEYGDELSYYYSVAPGITGLWQVSGRNYVSYPRRIALNTWYVKNWSLWHDITILFKTVRVVLTKEGAY